MTTELVPTEMMPGSNLATVISKADIDLMKKQRALMQDFIGSQLKGAEFKNKNAVGYGEGDFGVIPGTKKRTLFKQGAEKILRLFGLGARFRQTVREIDRAQNFCMFEYECEIYHLRNPATVIAMCAANANNLEKKYETRAIYENGRKVGEEPVPIGELINTLTRMAQKRALVGATLLATGASEFFAMGEIDDLGGESAADSKPQPEFNGPVPQCCGRPMMKSKFPDQQTGIHNFWCGLCKRQQAPDADLKSEVSK